jgi:hypothetical protein
MILFKAFAHAVIATSILPTSDIYDYRKKKVPAAVTTGAESTLHHRLRNGAKSNLTGLAQIHLSNGAAIQLGRGSPYYFG